VQALRPNEIKAFLINSKIIYMARSNKKGVREMCIGNTKKKYENINLSRFVKIRFLQIRTNIYFLKKRHFNNPPPSKRGGIEMSLKGKWGRE